MSDFFSTIITWYMENINYYTVALLMAVESSFVPFPSEIVVPPAAWKSAQGQLSLGGVIGSATLGALIGSLFNYFLALSLGRKILYKLAETRLAHMMLVSKDGLDKAESYFNKYGKSSTFIGRLVPALRQLISIPAGLSRMNLKHFVIFTFIGSSIWNIILTGLGYFLFSKKEVLEQFYHLIKYSFAGLGVLFVIYILYKGFYSKHKSSPS